MILAQIMFPECRESLLKDIFHFKFMDLNTENSDFSENLQAKMKTPFQQVSQKNTTNTAFSQMIDVFKYMS